MVYCAWKKTNDEFIITIELPESGTAILTMPDGSIVKTGSGKYSCKLK